MANNRLHIVCFICKVKGLKDAVLIGKYFPNTGWYRKLDNMDDLLDKFFAEHSHRDELTTVDIQMWGYHIGFSREINPDPSKS